MNIKHISVDLAKSVFQVCAIDPHNKVVFNRKLSRTKFMELMQTLPKSKVYMEACYSAHYWGRTLNEYGHSCFLIPAQHVKPFVRGNKNDSNDALAIAEAGQRPNIRFVPVKTKGQQEIISLHRIRQRLIKNRVQLSNQARGLLSDFGIIFAQGFKSFRQAMIDLQDNESLSLSYREVLTDLLYEFNELSHRIDTIEKILHQYIESSPSSQIIQSVPGIGLINASALSASIDKGQAYSSPREFAAWLGLTPSQYASGSKSRNGGITKRGDRYLRTQLIHGGRAAIRWAKERNDRLSVWINALVARIGIHKAIVAVAHKLARLIWILLQRQEMFKLQPVNWI